VEGSKEDWLLSLRPFGRKLFGRDKPSIALAEPLLQRIRAVLEKETSITDLEWLLTDPSAGSAT